MALPLLSRMISWPNSNIHNFSQDPSSLLQVHSTSHYLYYLQTYCFIHVGISRPHRYLYLSSHGRAHFATIPLLAPSSQPNLQLLWSYSLLSRVLSLCQPQCYMQVSFTNAIPLLHVLSRPFVLYKYYSTLYYLRSRCYTHYYSLQYMYLDVYLSTWNKRKPSYFVKAFVGWMTAVYLHS